MKYRLIITTNGRYKCLDETLASFRDHVSPHPTDGYVFIDGAHFASETLNILAEHPWTGWSTDWSQSPIGFCKAVQYGWDEGASCPADWCVFWLEDDFLFERDINLDELSEVLTKNPQLTQMALMRHPVNDAEIAAGGCYELRRDQYEDKGGWLESHTNHTTTCSLMTSEFVGEHPWPGDDGCEGKFSIDIQQEGFSFGVWGGGEPWIRHTGQRAGFGY